MDVAGVAVGMAGEGVADEALLSRVYTAEVERLAALGRILTGNAQTGEDLAHEVFLKLARELGRTPGFLREPAWPWLRTALVRAAVDWRRRAVREMQRLARAYQRPLDSGMPDGALDCLSALGSLPARMRACAVLCFGEDLSVRDAAEALGCSPRTVENQLREARRRLALLLADEDAPREGGR